MSKRTPIIAGNWKMYTTARAAAELCRSLRDRIDGLAGVEKVVCPPFVFLALAGQELAGSSIKVGAQNVYWEEEGAYTGEVSPPMLADLCEYVVVGHSERRKYFGETDETVNRRLKAAMAHGLRTIMCVGETLEEREGGVTEQVVAEQLDAVIDLEGATALADGVIAYEPVWAIGTGKSASGDDANKTIGFIRQFIAHLHGRGIANTVRILYGGSVTAANIAEFMRKSDIDGALVGGASLRADDFVSIVKQASEIKGI